MTGASAAYGISGPRGIYLVEKIASNEGWIPASPDEGRSLGYARELKNFIDCVREQRTPESDLALALDVTVTIYAGYVSAEERGKAVEVPGVTVGR